MRRKLKETPEEEYFVTSKSKTKEPQRISESKAEPVDGTENSSDVSTAGHEERVSP
jgi:hypothetical protein